MYMNYIQFRYTTVIYVQIFGQRRRILDIPALGRFYGMPASGLNQLYNFYWIGRGRTRNRTGVPEGAAVKYSFYY